MSKNALTLLKKSYRKAIELSKVAGIVWILQKTHSKKVYEQKKAALRAMPKNSVGKAIADLLDEHQLQLIPRFESHDLKHVLLGYGMNPEDEIKMQAFLLGNGNYSLPCVLFLSLGVFMPEIWKDLIQAYKKGKKTPSILHLKIENCAHRSLMDLKKEFKL